MIATIRPSTSLLIPAKATKVLVFPAVPPLPNDKVHNPLLVPEGMLVTVVTVPRNVPLIGSKALMTPGSLLPTNRSPLNRPKLEGSRTIPRRLRADPPDPTRSVA